MKIGIIGTGISGNLAARLLSQEHEIRVFESSPTVGGHTRTLNVNAFGQTWRVDTGFMVFNDRTYPNFCRLLQLLGLSGNDSDMSFSVACARSGLEYQGSSLNGLFAQRRNLIRPAFLRMLRDIMRFNRESKAMLASTLGEKTLRALLVERGYGAWFADKYLVPMTAAIWSCPPSRLWDFPAHFLLAFLRNHGLVQIDNRPQWKTVAGSARSYVDRLIAPFRDRIRANCPVVAVQRHEDHVVVHPRNAAPEQFDYVVLACHADQALAMLQDADDEEREILEAFPYHPNTAVLHTDTSILPRRRHAWASWNYHIPADECHPVAVTYDLSRLQNLKTPTPLLLTLNASNRIDPARVLDRYLFHHPGYTTQSLWAQERLRLLNGQHRTYYCGAYRGYGFHEDGVNSATGRDQTLWTGFGSMESCLYEGAVYHERLQPVKHRFHYRLYMNFIDLAEVPVLLRAGLLSETRFAPNGFLRRDHFGDQRQPLVESVRDLVLHKTGVVVDGPIRLLTQLRTFGYYFSPLNLFFCYAVEGKQLQAVVAEVQNTPWLERHCYVLWHGNQVGAGTETEFRHPKSFHVSPFMGMDVEYRWRLVAPSEKLQAGIENTQGNSPLFRASMRLRRVPLSRRTQLAMHWRFP